MLNVYVKANARAFFLDRCLRSIKAALTGFDRIIVLNDGITGDYLARLAVLHPEVQFRRSDRILNDRPNPAKARNTRVNPARFWVREISADPRDHVLILEEDTWITEPLDLAAIVPQLTAANALLLRLYWGANAAMSITQDLIREVPIDQGQRLQYYALPMRALDLREIYKIFPLAQAVFHKKYWIAAYSGTPYWDDEAHVLGKALTYVNEQLLAKRPIAFCSLDREIIRHTALSTSRSDSGGRGITHKIDAALYNNALNDAWLAHEIDPMANFPADPPDELVLEALQRRLSAAQIAAWRLWREDYTAMYRSLGVQL
jgi:glycosyltransferase involved in cell wall biosynthesis